MKDEELQDAQEWLKERYTDQLVHENLEFLSIMIEEYHQQGIREELLKFTRHYFDNSLYRYIDCDYIVDEWINKWKGE